MDTEQTDQTGLLMPDFTTVPEKIVPGTYKVIIKDAETKVNYRQDRDGKNISAARWTLQTFGEQDEKNNGRHIYHQTDVNGFFAGRFKDLYKAATGKEYEAGPFDPTTLYGLEIEVTVGLQKNDPQYSEVKAVRPISH